MNKTTCTKKNEVCNQIGCPDREKHTTAQKFSTWNLVGRLWQTFQIVYSRMKALSMQISLLIYVSDKFQLEA